MPHDQRSLPRPIHVLYRIEEYKPQPNQIWALSGERIPDGAEVVDVHNIGICLMHEVARYLVMFPEADSDGVLREGAA